MVITGGAVFLCATMKSCCEAEIFCRLIVTGHLGDARAVVCPGFVNHANERYATMRMKMTSENGSPFPSYGLFWRGVRLVTETRFGSAIGTVKLW
uniref:Putative secreted protein n=1 Tax=Anopheles marajoara TaxID=58244 RepID=A0A2M4C9L5_9DIPT